MVPRPTKTSDPKIISKIRSRRSPISAGEISPNFEIIYNRPKLALFMYFGCMNFLGAPDFASGF